MTLKEVMFVDVVVIMKIAVAQVQWIMGVLMLALEAVVEPRVVVITHATPILAEL